MPLAVFFLTTGRPAADAAARKRATADAGPDTLTLRPTSRPLQGPDTEVRAAVDSLRETVPLDPGARGRAALAFWRSGSAARLRRSAR